MSRRIGYLFEFPKEEEVCVLKPSVGDGKALEQVLSEKGKSKVFAVELNADTCKEKVEKNEFVDYYLKADAPFALVLPYYVATDEKGAVVFLLPVKVK